MASIKVSVLVENEVRGASANRLHANLTTIQSSPRPSLPGVEEKAVNFLKYIALKFCTDEKTQVARKCSL